MFYLEGCISLVPGSFRSSNAVNKTLSVIRLSLPWKPARSQVINIKII